MDSSALGGSPTQLGPTQATNRSRPRLPGATRAHPGEDNWSDARLPTPFGSGQQGRTGATLSGARRTRPEAPTRDVAVCPMRGLRQSAVGPNSEKRAPPAEVAETAWVKRRPAWPCHKKQSLLLPWRNCRTTRPWKESVSKLASSAASLRPPQPRSDSTSIPVSGLSNICGLTKSSPEVYGGQPCRFWSSLRSESR